MADRFITAAALVWMASEYGEIKFDKLETSIFHFPKMFKKFNGIFPNICAVNSEKISISQTEIWLILGQGIGPIWGWRRNKEKESLTL